MTANGATTCDGTGLMARVGMRVREARQALSLSRRALSEASGVSQRYLALLEGGQGNISISLLEKVAAALGSSVETLVAVGAPAEIGMESTGVSLTDLLNDQPKHDREFVLIGRERNDVYARPGVRGISASQRNCWTIDSLCLYFC